MGDLDRRRFLRTASAAAVAAFLQPWRGAGALARPRFTNDPFSLGVASGDPLADGVVLWTRLVPDPFDPHAMPPEPVEVGWEIAGDDRFRSIVQSGVTIARPDRGHAVHQEVHGLEPDRPYWYRFHAGGIASRVGRTFTTPTPFARKKRLRLAVASCQNYALGYFSCYRDMIDQDVSLIAHTGDYIYEFDSNRGGPRAVPVPVAETLQDYRLLYSVYRLDPDLQAAHAHAPWIVTWDDHEVESDYAGIHSAYFVPPEEFLVRRRQAYQAYVEHMPLRLNNRLRGDTVRLHDLHVYGDLAQIHVTDTRQYRDDQACVMPGDPNGRAKLITCEERLDPKRSILGKEQEGWLFRTLGYARAKWNVLLQHSMFAGPIQFDDRGNRAWWSDSWDGYPASRQRIVRAILRRNLKNFVSLGGDIHGNAVSNVLARSGDPESPVIGSEFVTTSITSKGNPRLFDEFLKDPNVLWADARERGYVLCDLDHRRWRTRLRVVDSVLTRTPTFRDQAVFVVRPGHPGPRQVA